MASKRRGNSLAEVLVACAIFSIILVVVVLISRTGRDALEKTGAQSDPFRMAAIAEDHLKSELRGGRILCPTLAGERTKIVLYQPDLLDAERVPRFEPGISPPMLRLRTARTTIDVLTNARGSQELVRRGGGRPDRKLADLGPAGRLELHFSDSTVAAKVLSVTIIAATPNDHDSTRSGSYKLDVDLALTDTFELTPDEVDAAAEPPPEPDEPEPDPEL